MVAANAAAPDARYIRRLHASIGKPIPHPTPLMIDSESPLTWTKVWRDDGNMPRTDASTRSTMGDGELY